MYSLGIHCMFSRCSRSTQNINANKRINKKNYLLICWLLSTCCDLRRQTRLRLYRDSVNKNLATSPICYYSHGAYTQYDSTKLN